MNVRTTVSLAVAPPAAPPISVGENHEQGGQVSGFDGLDIQSPESSS